MPSHQICIRDYHPKDHAQLLSLLKTSLLRDWSGAYWKTFLRPRPMAARTLVFLSWATGLASVGRLGLNLGLPFGLGSTSVVVALYELLIAALVYDAHGLWFVRNVMSLDMSDSALASFAIPPNRYFVAHPREASSQVVGCMALFKIDDSVAKIRRISVDHQVRRRGVATLLSGAAMAEAKRAGFEKLRVTTTDSREVALQFYQSIGFKVVGERDANRFSFFHGIKDLDLEMQL